MLCSYGSYVAFVVVVFVVLGIFFPSMANKQCSLSLHQ